MKARPIFTFPRHPIIWISGRHILVKAATRRRLCKRRAPRKTLANPSSGSIALERTGATEPLCVIGRFRNSAQTCEILCPEACCRMAMPFHSIAATQGLFTVQSPHHTQTCCQLRKYSPNYPAKQRSTARSGTHILFQWFDS